MRRALLAIALMGCGGSLTDLEGVYTIQTRTQNSMTCDAEGPSILAGDAALYIKIESFIGHRFVNVVTCTDVADCQAKGRDDSTLNLGGFAFENGSDSGGWTSHDAFGFLVQASCMGDVTDTEMTNPASGSIRIERRQTQAAPFAPTGSDCPDSAAEAAAVGQPCSLLEVLTATFTTGF